MFRFPQRKFIYTKLIFIGNEFSETRFHQSLLAPSNYLYKLGYLLLLFCLPSSFVALAQWRTSSNFLWCPEAQRLSLHSLCQKWYFQPHHRQKVQGFHQRLTDRWSAQGNFPRELVRPSTKTPSQCSSNLLFGTSLLDQADQKEKNKKQTVVSRLKFATVFVLL